EGRMSVVAVVPERGTDPAQLLRLAGAVEHASEHPIARAIASAAAADAALPAVESFQNIEGRGVSGVVEGRALLVGRVSLLEDWSVHPSDELLAAKADAESAGQTAVLVAWDGAARGMIVVADEVKA